MVKYMDYVFIKVNTLCLFSIANSINTYELIIFDKICYRVALKLLLSACKVMLINAFDVCLTQHATWQISCVLFLEVIHR